MTACLQTKFADISHAGVPPNWMIEDPFMWVDKRGSWHIINHACESSLHSSGCRLFVADLLVDFLDRRAVGTDNNHEFKQCGNSTLSAHFFSPNGSTWFNLATRPYDHTVHCELIPHLQL